MITHNVNIAWSEVERRQARIDAAGCRRYLDRVPVVPGIAARFWLHAFGKSWSEYTASPAAMIELQLAAHAWVLENVPGDVTGVGISAEPFSFYGESYAFGCELGCDELTPWITSHPVHGPADLDRIAAIDVADNRYTNVLRRWIADMEPLLGEHRFRYADGVLRLLPERLSVGWGTIGVFTLATDLRGPEIYADLIENPTFAHELLDILTEKTIARYRWLRSQRGGPERGTYLVDDSSGALSPRLYREFVLPCVKRVVEAIGRPLMIHIDAPANHLLPIYEELGIDQLLGFGWKTDLALVRRHLGGRTYLTGNLEPGLFVLGTPDEVYAAAWHALEVLAPCGGFVLCEGANMAPGAKLANIAAMLRAAEDYGLPASGALCESPVVAAE